MNALDVPSRPTVRKITLTERQAEAIASVAQSSDWFWQLPPTELAKYANKSVAISECEVVAVAPTRPEVEAIVSQFDRSRVYVVSFPILSRARIRRP